MEAAAKAIAALGPRNVLIKGGHWGDHGSGDLTENALDILYAGGRFYRFSSKRIATPHTHGTGCTHSAAITAELAKGAGLVEAVANAKNYITRAIESNPSLGHGSGPVNHHAAI